MAGALVEGPLVEGPPGEYCGSVLPVSLAALPWALVALVVGV